MATKGVAQEVPGICGSSCLESRVRSGMLAGFHHGSQARGEAGLGELVEALRACPLRRLEVTYCKGNRDHMKMLSRMFVSVNTAWISLVFTGKHVIYLDHININGRKYSQASASSSHMQAI